MKLARAATFFDRQVFADAYNPATTFKGQFGLYDDSTRDGMTVERRVISVGPSEVLPPRRTVSINGTYWLLGDGHIDYYKANAIRDKYVAHRASELASVKTFSEAIANTSGLQAWAAKHWVKPSKEIETSSLMVNVFDIYLAQGEAVVPNALVYLNARWHIVRDVYPSAAGLLVALADELPEPVRVTATLKKRTYVPASDSYTEVTATPTVLRLHWQSYFRYVTKASEKYEPGDLVLIIRQSDATVIAGDRIVIGSDTLNVVAVLNEGATWAAHVRHD